MTARPVFVISDRTGITAEIMSHSLLSQFPHVEFSKVALPFIDTDDKVNRTVEQINDAGANHGVLPLVFATFVNDEHMERLRQANAVFYDLFGTFLRSIEHELHAESSHEAGHTHGVVDPARYTSRISAVHYSMDCDDGVNTADYRRANLILMGVSRSGKTPTCIYLAMHFGLFCANYPLTEEELDTGRLPESLREHRNRLFGLTIEPARLQQIRQERRADSRYSQLKTCRYEVQQAEALFRQHGIPCVDTTAVSIEEISATVLHRMNIQRQIY